MERPIVCGTDFSPVAGEAVEIAAAMARRLGTKVILVHVEEFHGMAEVDPSLFEGALTEKKSALERAAKRMRDSGTEVELRLLSGSVFDEMITAVTEANARLVVIGAVGCGLARRLLLGSVAERTAEISPVPTLVVRPGERLGGWLRGEHPLKVLIGYDFSPASDAALAWVKDLQHLGRCEIAVLHIVEQPDKSQQILERKLSEHVGRWLSEDVTAAVESSWGSQEGALFEAAQREAIDLVVVGTHQRHGLSRMRFGSVSRAVLRHATQSVAVVAPSQNP